MAASLQSFVKRQTESTDVEAVLALADAYARGMKLQAKAIELLSEEVEREPSPRLIDALVRYQSEAGDLEGAVKCLTMVISSHPREATHWRRVTQLYDQQQSSANSLRSRQALALLGAAEPGTESILAQHKLSGGLVPGALDAGLLHGVTQGNVSQTPSAQVLSTLSEAIGKTMGHDLRGLNLGRRDRIQNFPDHPIQATIGAATTLSELKPEFYLVKDTKRLVHIGLRDPVIVAIDERIAELAPAAQLFLIVRVVALGAAGLHSLATLSPEEVDRILGSMARGNDELGQALWKAQPRRARKALEASLSSLGPIPTPARTLREVVVRAANRIACLVCDDIRAAVHALELVHREEGVSAEETRREIDALLSYWLTPSATALRKQLGIR
jgi:hypothetical protein